MNRRARILEIAAGRDTARYTWLLAALVASLALPPLLQAMRIDIPSVRVGFTAVLLGATFVVSRRPRILWTGVALAAPALVLDWASLSFGSRALAMAASALAVVFLGLVIATLVAALLRADRVTTDTMLGGICVYLLLGVLWVSAFTLLETVAPGSVLLGGEALSAQAEAFRYSELLYFSFVTLTTLGYGDVLPATAAARALAAGEAVIGQLYVAIFVARLVGLHLAHVRQD